jgi:3-oxoacyl-[acyl-carrier protein] reductase
VSAAEGRLSGRVALVTGGAQGIGRALSQRFAADGANVVIADLQGDRAAATAEEVGSERALGVACDVADAASVQAAVDAAVERFGHVDVLVNNAALFSTLDMQPFEEIDLDQWRRVLDVNLTGPFICCRAVAPIMRKLGRGRIVNISSSTVLMGRPYYAHYVASKAGVVGLTRALANELGSDGITVNAVMPGYTQTEVPRKTVTPQQAEKLVGMQAIQRQLTPDDLVGAIAFLASDDAAFMTGQTLLVDGGVSFL